MASVLAAALVLLLGRLVPVHKTIADFCEHNSPAIRKVCARLVELCRRSPAAPRPP